MRNANLRMVQFLHFKPVSLLEDWLVDAQSPSLLFGVPVINKIKVLEFFVRVKQLKPLLST